MLAGAYVGTVQASGRVPLGIMVLPAQVHYGWSMDAGSALPMSVTVGGYYGLPVFLRPLQDEQGGPTATVSGATGPGRDGLIGRGSR